MVFRFDFGLLEVLRDLVYAFLVVNVPLLQIDPVGVVDPCSADAVRSELDLFQPLLMCVHVSANVVVSDRLLTHVHEKLLFNSSLLLGT